MKTSCADPATEPELSRKTPPGLAATRQDLLVSICRTLLSLLIRAALKIYTRFEVIGGEHLHSNRSLVLVANHCSHLDTVCLLSALPIRKLRHAFSAAAADYFFRSGLRASLATVTCNAFPFGRNRHARHSLSVCLDLLRRPGNIVIIFPEGTRSCDGALHEFKSGIGTLLHGRDIAVVPCFLDGPHRVWPKGRRMPRPGKVRLFIGEPRNYHERRASRSEAIAIAAELRDAVMQLQKDHAATV